MRKWTERTRERLRIQTCKFCITLFLPLSVRYEMTFKIVQSIFRMWKHKAHLQTKAYRRVKLLKKFFNKWRSKYIEDNIVRHFLMKRVFSAWKNVTNKFTQLVPRQFFTSIFFKRWLQQFTESYRNQVTDELVDKFSRRVMIRSVISRWRERTYEKIQRHEKTILAREHYLLKMGLKVLREWSFFSVNQRRKREKQDLADRFYNDKLQSLSRVVSTERLFDVPIDQLPSFFEQTFAMRKYKLMAKYIDAWKLYCDHRRYKSKLIAKAVRSREYLLRKRYFERWRVKAQMMSHKHFKKERHVHHHHHYIVNDSMDSSMVEPKYAERAVATEKKKKKVVKRAADPYHRHHHKDLYQDALGENPQVKSVKRYLRYNASAHL
jgi:hypothetical protein